MSLITVSGDRGPLVRGKSELHRAGCWITSRGGDPTESAAEKETASSAAPKLLEFKLRLNSTLLEVNKGLCSYLNKPRVLELKRCGKSAPVVKELASLANPIRSKTK